MRDWEDTQPWNVDRATAESGGILPPGVRYSPSLSGQARYDFGSGRILLGPSFFDQPEDARRSILYHEAGHALDTATVDTQWDAFDRLAPEVGGSRMVWGYENPSEAVAESYAALHTAPQDRAAQQEIIDRNGYGPFIDWVADQAESAGLPVPWRPVPRSGSESDLTEGDFA